MRDLNKRIKRMYIPLILITYLFIFSGCRNGQNSFCSPIVKSVGKIDIVVDPKVEMMMILGRLDKVHPYADLGVNNYEYLSKIDDYFSTYKNKDKIFAALSP
jgi:hypothetical protein